MDVIVALSGGVDSAVTAHLVREAGHRVVAGVTMTLGAAAPAHGPSGPGGEADIAAAAALCARLGVPHVVIDVAESFLGRVLRPCREACRAGATPNPCTLCNPAVKFGALPALARGQGLKFDAMATGHYARIEDAKLARGADRARDQSYFLYRVPRETFAHVLFPLGGMTKTETRALAATLGLETADKPDSQDLCMDVEEFREGGDEPGDVKDTAGRTIGRHPGLRRITLGQRKGLGISGTGDPLYAVAIDVASNTVTVGPKSEVTRNEIFARDCAWTSIETPAAGEVIPCSAKIRSVGEPAEGCTAEILPDGGFRLTCPRGFFAPAPGQSAVLYRGETVLGGGVIC